MQTLVLEAHESSNIRGVRYDPATEVLEIDFKNGTTYRYANFSILEWKRFRVAPSKGRHFMSDIRPVYKGVKLPASAPADEKGEPKS